MGHGRVAHPFPARRLIVWRREPARFFQQGGHRIGRTAGSRPGSSLIQRCRHIAIGIRRRQGKVPRTLLDVDDSLRQPAVERATLTGRLRYLLATSVTQLGSC